METTNPRPASKRRSAVDARQTNSNAAVLDHGPEERSIRATLIERLSDAPDQVWLTLLNDQTDQQFTHQQLLARIADYCRYYDSRNVEPGQTVLIVLRESLDLFASFLAGVVHGALPAYFAYPSAKQSTAQFVKSIEQLIQHNQIRLVVTYDEVSQVLERECDHSLRQSCANYLGAVDADEVPRDDATTLPECEREAFLQFSSGTTGAKKGVRISSSALFHQIDAYLPHVAFNANSIVVSWLPHYHDMGLIACMLTPLLTGVPIVMMSPFAWVRRPVMLLEAITRNRGTHVWLPNFALSHMTKSVAEEQLAALDLSSIQRVVCCSEPVLRETAQAFAEKFRRCGLDEAAIHNCYAMAENTFAMTTTGPDTPLSYLEVDLGAFQREGRVAPQAGGRSLASAGRPLENIQIRCVAENGRPLEECSVGEIQIQSDCMLDGYHNNPEATDEALDDGWFRTGDLGFFYDGQLYVTGRKKDIMIIGGENIYPHDVQLILNQQPGFIPGRNVVFGVDDARVGTERMVVLAEVEDEHLGADVTLVKTKILNTLNVSVSTILLLPHRTLKKSTAGKISNFTNKNAYLAGEYDGLTQRQATIISPTKPSSAVDRRRDAAVLKAVRSVLPEQVAATLVPDTRLITSGVVDSFTFAELVATIEGETKTKIPQTLWSPTHFDSVERICAMVKRLQQPGGAEVEATRDPAAFESWRANLQQLKESPTGVAKPGGWWEWIINRCPIRSSWLYTRLLRLAGVQVGQGVKFLGGVHLKIRGKAGNIRIGDHVTLGDRVDLRNREDGRIEIAERAYLDQNVRVVAAREGSVRIGFGAEIGANTVINSGGDTSIGQFAMIASNVNINSSTHGSDSRACIKSQAHQHGSVEIGDDVWIGSGASVLLNTTIQDGAVVSSNSLVSGEIPSMAICAGVPARVISFRNAGQHAA